MEDYRKKSFGNIFWGNRPKNLFEKDLAILKLLVIKFKEKNDMKNYFPSPLSYIWPLDEALNSRKILHRLWNR